MESKFNKVTFNFKKDLENSVMVQKKTKKINKIFFIPKSLIKESDNYLVNRSLDKDCKYTVNRICLTLPKWYCKKELGFFK